MKSFQLRWESMSSVLFLIFFGGWVLQGVFASDDSVDWNEDEGSTAALGSNATTSIRSAYDDESLDATVIAFCFLLCALAVSLFGTGLAYFSCLEDRLMRRYAQEGVKLHANVWTADFTRMRPSTPSPSAAGAACCSTSCVEPEVDGGDDDYYDPSYSNKMMNSKKKDNALADQEEYLAIIDYRLEDIEGDPADHTCLVVRKQVKAWGSDFCSTQASPSNQNGVQVQLEFTDSCSVSPAHSNSTKDMSNKNNSSNNNSADNMLPPLVSPASTFLPLMQLPILVLPEFKNSAVPAHQVERVCRWNYRLPTMTMVMCAFGFVWLCLFLGFSSLLSSTGMAREIPMDEQQQEHGGQEQLQFLWLWSGVALMACLGTALTVIHFCLSGIMLQVLTNEYLDGGDMVLPPIGDSYSISSGDDVYLMF